MARGRSRSRFTAVLLLVPLAAVAGWLAHGILNPSPAPAGLSPVVPAPVPSPSSPVLSGFPEPGEDLPADRLHERVDGAEDYLRAEGCVRMLAWELAEPRGSLEILLFSSPEGAGRVLAHDAGPKRTAGPGDEASADAQGVLFRRGKAYVRLIADPDAAAEPARLLGEAAKVDRAILDGMGRGL
jgi:hypothetical protein